MKSFYTLSHMHDNPKDIVDANSFSVMSINSMNFYSVHSLAEDTLSTKRLQSSVHRYMRRFARFGTICTI